MRQTPKASPQKLAMMAAGAILALGFAVWSIGSALAPSGGSSQPATSPTTAANADGEGLGFGTAPTQPTPGGTAAPGAVAAPGAAPAGAPVPGGGYPESAMAAGANPFRPLAEPATAPASASPAVSSGSGGVSPAGRQGIPLPPVQPSPPGGFGGGGGGTPPPPQEPEPKLVGTMMGEQPSAVFRAETGVVIVPVGQTYGSWTVVAVYHGAAKVRNSFGTRNLSVAGGGIKAAPRSSTPIMQAGPSEAGMMATMAAVAPPETPVRSAPEAPAPAAPAAPAPAAPLPAPAAPTPVPASPTPASPAPVPTTPVEPKPQPVPAAPAAPPAAPTTPAPESTTPGAAPK